MGESFGRYEVIKRIGRGGMAEVFHARFSPAPGVTKDVVLKRILPAYAEVPEFRAMFLAEARLSMRLSHGNIVQVFDAGDVDDNLFIAMELVDGVSLEELMARARKRGLIGVPPVVAALILIEVLKGLHHAHTRTGDDGQPLNLVHRDVSPDNVLVSFDGEVKVTDFGIAKAALAGRELTRPGIFKGKFTYGAPEQARGETVDARADIYAAGIVLYELITGSNPSGPTEIAKEVGAGMRTLPRFPVHLADPEFVTVISRALAPLPSERYANAQMFQQALIQWSAVRAGSLAASGISHAMRWLFPDELQARNPGLVLGPEADAFLELMASRTERGAEAPTRDGLPAFARAAEPAIEKPPESPLTAADGMTIKQVSAIGFIFAFVLLGIGIFMWSQERADEVDSRAQLQTAMHNKQLPPPGPLQPKQASADVDAGTWAAPPAAVFAVHGVPAEVRLTSAHLFFVDGASFVEWTPTAKLKVLQPPRANSVSIAPIFAMQRMGDEVAVSRLEVGRPAVLAPQKGSVQLFAVTHNPTLMSGAFTPARVELSSKLVLLQKSVMQLVSKDRCLTIDGLWPKKAYQVSITPVTPGGKQTPVLVMAIGDKGGRPLIDGYPGVTALTGGDHLVTNTALLQFVLPTLSGAAHDDVMVKVTGLEASAPGKKVTAVPAATGAIQIATAVPEAKPHFDRAVKAIGAGQSADARDALMKGLKLDPKNPAAHYWAGVLAQRIGDTTDAMFQFRFFLKVAPDDHPNRQEVTGLLAALEKNK